MTAINIKNQSNDIRYNTIHLKFHEISSLKCIRIISLFFPPWREQAILNFCKRARERERVSFKMYVRYEHEKKTFISAPLIFRLHFANAWNYICCWLISCCCFNRAAAATYSFVQWWEYTIDSCWRVIYSINFVIGNDREKKNSLFDVQHNCILHELIQKFKHQGAWIKDSAHFITQIQFVIEQFFLRFVHLAGLFLQFWSG